MNSNRLNHSFSVELAEIYGIECAIVIHHLQYWIEHNQVLGRNFHEGRTWMYQTQKEMAAHFTYLSEDSVCRILKKLEEHEIIIKGNFNKSKFDKTSWYAFKNEEIFTKPRNRGNGTNESRNQDCEIAEPIPNNIPDNIPDDKAPPPKPPPKKDPHYHTDRSAGGAIKYFNGKGEEKEISESDIFKHFLKFKYPTAIVEEAMEIAKKEATPINNILKFLEAICLRVYKNIKIPQDILSIAEPEKIKEVKTCNLGDLLYGKKPIRKPI